MHSRVARGMCDTNKLLATKIQDQEHVFLEAPRPDPVAVLMEEVVGKGLRLAEEVDAFRGDS